MVNVKPVDRKLGIKLYTGAEGLAMVLKDYQEVAMRHLWKEPGKDSSSCDVWIAVNAAMPEKGGGKPAISRASIINFLNAMVDEGVLSFTEITGKGGHRRIYSPKYDESGFKQWIAETVLGAMLRDFKAETQAAVHKVLEAEG